MINLGFINIHSNYRNFPRVSYYVMFEIISYNELEKIRVEIPQ